MTEPDPRRIGRAAAFRDGLYHATLLIAVASPVFYFALLAAGLATVEATIVISASLCALGLFYLFVSFLLPGREGDLDEEILRR